MLATPQKNLMQAASGKSCTNSAFAFWASSSQYRAAAEPPMRISATGSRLKKFLLDPISAT
jgi:hypothetical protein